MPALISALESRSAALCVPRFGQEEERKKRSSLRPKGEERGAQNRGGPGNGGPFF